MVRNNATVGQGAKPPLTSFIFSSLRSSEWSIVGSLLLILASILLIARVTASSATSELAMQSIPPHELCSVKVDGAVKKPGTYRVLPGTPIKKVVMKSGPSRFADLKKIDLNARVEGPLEIHLDEMTEIFVRIEGALPTPLALTLPVGTKVSDLRAKIALNSDADRAVFKSRRMLKDGEILRVPEKRG